ncbi:hypothetical protein OY671_012327, partial [Metschnikowia pulcherrima]
GEITGWGESVAMISPLYSSEYVAAGIDVTRRWSAPSLFDVDDLSAETVSWHSRHVIGHPMAKSASEMAVIEAQSSLGVNSPQWRDWAQKAQEWQDADKEGEAPEAVSERVVTREDLKQGETWSTSSFLAGTSDARVEVSFDGKAPKCVARSP